MIPTARISRPVRAPRIKRWKLFSARNLKIVLTLACVACLLAHSYEVIENYLAYKTVTGVNIGHNNVLISPRCTICILIRYLMPEGINYKKQSNEFVTNYSTNLEDHTYAFKGAKPVHGREILNLFTFYKRWNVLKCLTVTNPAPLNPRVDLTLNFVLQFGKFIKSEAFPIILFIHHPDTLAYDEDNILTGYNVKDNSTMMSYRFGFDLVTSNYLQSPFPDDCTIYHRRNFSSRGDCVAKCIREVMVKKFGDDPYNPDGFYDTFVSHPRPSRYDIYNYLPNATDICRPKCNHNCTTNNYFPIYNNQNQAEPGLLYIFILKTRPRIIIDSQPELPLGGLIIYLAGVIGIWTGFNALTIACHIPEMFEKISAPKVISQPTVDNSNVYDMCSRMTMKMQLVERELLMCKNQITKLKNK